MWEWSDVSGERSVVHERADAAWLESEDLTAPEDLARVQQRLEQNDNVQHLVRQPAEQVGADTERQRASLHAHNHHCTFDARYWELFCTTTNTNTEYSIFAESKYDST